MKISNLMTTTLQESIFSEKYYDRIRDLGKLYHYGKDNFDDLDEVIEFVAGSDVIITSWGTPALNKEILDACPDLKAVIHAAGSIKPLLSAELIEKKIRITNSAVAIGEGVAETALGFALAACKGFFQLNKDTSNKLWRENVETTVKDFYDIVIGVISGGFVGQHMVKLLKNFHVTVLMYDPILSKVEIEAIGAKKVDLEELLSSSDVITVHAPSIPSTNSMLNKDNLKLIRDGAVLINTARGSVIQETDLINELKKNRFFACIDVTNPEPPTVDNELRFLDNVVLTPHIAGTATNGLKRIALHVCEEIERFFHGEKMKTEVNPADLSKSA